MLFNIFLKTPSHVVEIMFVLIVLLFVLTVVHNGVHHTCAGGHGSKKQCRERKF